MDSDSGYDFDYDGGYSDDGGYYDGDDGGYYSSGGSDVYNGEEAEESYAGDDELGTELGVNGSNNNPYEDGGEEDYCGEVEVEEGAEHAGDYGGELQEEEGYSEGEEDDGFEVGVGVEVDTEDDYEGQLEVPIEGEEDDDSDFNEARAIIGYRDESEDEEEEVWRISSSLIGRTLILLEGDSNGGVVRRREADQARGWSSQTAQLEQLREICYGSDNANGSHEPRREMNQARTSENVTENDGVGKVRDGKGVSNFQEKEGVEIASSSGGMKLNGSEMDGFSCPICMEAWTTEGNHSICCLPCGHFYGMSCIKSWLLQPNSGKCPQCNKACCIEDIRRIYGLMIGTIDKDLQEKIKLLEAKCASLELQVADWQRKEAVWLHKEALLHLQLKQESKVDTDYQAN